MACAIGERLLDHAQSSISYPLSARLKQHYSVHLFHARARLDLPTFEDPAVQRQLDEASGTSRGSIAWKTFKMVSFAISTSVQITTQTTVLAGILTDQLDGPLLAGISMLQSIFDWFVGHQMFAFGATGKAPILEQSLSPF